MAGKTAKSRKTAERGTAAAKRTPSPGNTRLSVDKRLSAVFDSITEELLTTLEHNYDRNKR